ncbi:hypothetical protein P1X14_04210 [Sphingomonas sp. AOB5]|uniref:hypothetical protein n=1 Tax=Sphingomonas sp. AOB5 TaxID=3034017 RepID=UPI0023F6E002|nr:hypothetical protein [Sphingomonas sp. AOB5]MDF7774440.1 hypothetical protein [Sphingomonas sp. AOB5]
MHYDTRKRLAVGVLFAIAAGALVWFSNPVDRIKADVRADTNGFVLSLEYTSRLLG